MMVVVVLCCVSSPEDIKMKTTANTICKLATIHRRHTHTHTSNNGNEIQQKEQKTRTKEANLKRQWF